MKKTACLGLVALLTLVGCSGMKVFIDYDRDADFDSFKTFAWADTSEMSLKETSPLMHQRIIDAVQAKLVEGGLRKVASNPDLYVTYHTDEQQEMRLNTTHFGYGFGGSWVRGPGWGGMGSSSTTVQQYTRGTLLVDIWNASTKNLVWRGTVEKVVSENPEQSSRQILAAVDALAKKWQEMREKNAG